jgi:hypothetical protein
MEAKEIQWLCHPEAETFIAERLRGFFNAFPSASAFADSLGRRTSTSIDDWLDHVILSDGDAPRGRLADLGFEPEDVPTASGDRAYHHPGTIFPRIVLRQDSGLAAGSAIGVAIQVEDISAFLMAHRLAAPIEGTPVSPYRKATAWQADGRRFLVVERRGHGGFVPLDMPPDYAQRYLHASEQWATRRRTWTDNRAGMEHTLRLARTLVAEMGTDVAAWIAFAVERAGWQRRNRAGQIQKARQDGLGLGWANHDHHTFRSSRDTFSLLLEVLETFGFRPRERFYAGAEAGWGAQVLEQPTCRFAVFADVDLSPSEVEGDFAHAALALRQELGTVGLWCALHGESMLSAGMHHLACRFDFESVTAGLAESGIKMMRPFSDFPYLRQAFTQGESWEVAPDRIDRLAAAGQIDDAHRLKFVEKGALGSHLENIQRGEGFKGFNQQTVSDIIRRTDPRIGFGAA